MTDMDTKLNQYTAGMAAHLERRTAEIEAERAANGGKMKKHDFQQKACITYWYRKLLSTPVSMPRTVILEPDVDLHEFCSIFDGDRCPPAVVEKFEKLARDIEFQCKRVGYPVFLRTGTTSGKHSWKDTCFIAGPETNIKRHLGNLIEDAAMKDQCLDVFAVRELLPTEPLFHAFSGEMPIVKERRFFVRDGMVLGHIPYWPKEAFRGQPTSVANWEWLVDELADLNPEDERELTRMTKQAAWVLEGEWSIDWLLTKKGWYLTDCAPARQSYGWNLLPPEVREP
jgi:hypothetical protein